MKDKNTMKCKIIQLICNLLILINAISLIIYESSLVQGKVRKTTEFIAVILIMSLIEIIMLTVVNKRLTRLNRLNKETK
jgi:membrane-bound acyltransferase YfiQ involved in biofilm formation